MGRFEDYGSMVRASELFVARLQGKPIATPVVIENVASPRLACGHSDELGTVLDGRTICRRCRRAVAERQREKRLPGQLERARLRVAALETELERRGILA